MSIGELREKIIAATELGEPFGQNVHESKQVIVRTADGKLHALNEVAISAVAGRFVMVLEASEVDFR